MSDLNALAGIVDGSDYFRDVLRHDFADLADFWSHLERARSALFRFGDTNRLLGWAACYDFHARAGYARSAHFALGLSQHLEEATLGDAVTQLFRCCASACPQLGFRNLITFCTPQMTRRAALLTDCGFQACGAISVVAGEELSVFCRRLDS